MKINGKEVNLLPKRLAVELYWTKKAEDILNFGSFYYEPFELALIIWASAVNWSKVNGKPSQIDLNEVVEYLEGELSNEQAQEIKTFCEEFIDSNFYKEKTEKIIKAAEEEVKKKNLTGESLESNVISQESDQASTTDGL